MEWAVVMFAGVIFLAGGHYAIGAMNTYRSLVVLLKEVWTE